MRNFIAVCTVFALGLAAPAAAQRPDGAPAEAESFRHELEQMRRQFERVQQEYQKAIERMGERLQRLEARPQTAAAPPAVVQAPAGPPATPPSTPPASALEYLRRREPFSLAERTGGGRLLFDMGVAADFVANLTQDNVDKADGGTFFGRENSFFPREVEVSLFGQIDPYARGEVRIEVHEEFEDGERETHIGLAEAHLTLLTVPWGFQPKLGQMRNRFGLLNPLHAHDLPQIDRPNVLSRFFGEEGLVERGVEVSWVAPLPFYVELLGGLFDGDNEEAFGRSSLKVPLVTGRLRTFFELGRLGAVQLGSSVANGQMEERRPQTFFGIDVKYKHTPEGWRHPLFTLGGEGIGSIREAGIEEEIDTDGDGDPDATVTVDTRTRRRFGWYTWAEVQPARRWAAGLRYDSTQFLEAAGREWAVGPYVAFMPSDFLRFRLGYKHTERDRRETFNLNGGSARIVDEIFLQASFILGAHPAHPF